MIKLVLDTNVVLDWLVFNESSMNILRCGLLDNRIVVLTHSLAINELRRVLNYPQLNLDITHQAEILTQYQAETTIATMPTDFSLENLQLPIAFPRCRDRDDQPFLALAYHSKANALVSRDKAVLNLKGRAYKFGQMVIDVAEMAAMLEAP